MAPYRNNRASGRSTRTQIDHDVFDGLPVRHWRKAPVTVNPPPQRDTINASSRGHLGWPELPMPRDAGLYSPMSQALLRAARMGQVNKPAPPPLEDEKEPGEEEDAADVDTGFVAKRWAVVPRHLEGPEPEFLAKRRKGLPSVYGGAAGVVGGSGQMRKTKVRKIDASGTVTVLDVLVPEGQTVEGEIVEEEITSTEALAPGTVVDGVGVVNAEGVVIAGDQVLPTPPRRRPPPPKRKPKAPSRGRRKKVGFVPITATQGASGKPQNLALGVGEDGLNLTNGHEDSKEDVEMGEDSVLQDGEDVGEEGSEDDDEGEEGDEGDREEGELSPSPSSLSKSPSKAPQPTPSAEPDGDAEAPDLDLTGSAAPRPREPSSSPDLPLAAAGQGFVAPKIQVDLAENTVMVAAPTLDQIATRDPILVEDPPIASDTVVNTELPAEHNPMDGLAEPGILEDLNSASVERRVSFPDGDEDLLGSLERSLDKRDS